MTGTFSSVYSPLTPLHRAENEYKENAEWPTNENKGADIHLLTSFVDRVALSSQVIGEKFITSCSDHLTSAYLPAQAGLVRFGALALPYCSHG